MVTLRPCRQASMLFTSTLAAHLKIGSDEPARTEKVQSINWATEAGVLQLDFSKKKKKQKASHHFIFHQNNRGGRNITIQSSVASASAALLGTVHTTCIYSSVLSTPGGCS